MEPEQLTFGEIVQKSCEFLIRKKIPSPKCDAEWIVAQVTGKTRLELYLNFNDIVPASGYSKTAIG